MTRAKFRCDAVASNKTTAGVTHNITLRPVTNGSDENKSFYQYTPAGSIELTVVTQGVADMFEPGKEYFVDFTEAPQ